MWVKGPTCKVVPIATNVQCSWHSYLLRRHDVWGVTRGQSGPSPAYGGVTFIGLEGFFQAVVLEKYSELILCDDLLRHFIGSVACIIWWTATLRAGFPSF